MAPILGLLIVGSLACTSQHPPRISNSTVTPTASITPNWTIPAPPSATVGQSYTASAPATTGASYLWTVAAGHATLLNTTAATVTFTPTAAGSLTLQCVITSAGTATTLACKLTTASGATLNAEPATISSGQGTILLATFTGSTGVITPGNLSVTSGVGLTIQPSGTTTYTLAVDGTTVATAPVTVKQFVPAYVYVSDIYLAISAFTLNTTTGDLTEVTDSPYTGITPDQVVASPDGKFLFAAGLDNGVYAFSIAPSTGALTPVTGSPFAAGSTVHNIAVDPYERFLYTSGSDGNVYAYTIDQSTGVLGPIAGSPYATAANDRGGVLVHPSGKYLYAVASNSAKVYAFSMDQTTGALAAVAAPFDASGTVDKPVVQPFGVAVDPAGAYLFTKGEKAAADSNYMVGFSVDIATGALTVLPTPPMGPFPGDDAFHGLCFHPTLDVLYTAFYDSTSADAAAYALNPSTGVLTAMAAPYNLFSDYDHGSDNITVDRSGQFAYSVSFDGGEIARMRVGSTGLLTKLDGTALGVGALKVDTTYVYDEPVCTTVAGTLEDIQ
ncbi:MAG: beta-propeller fold lactonase family protein [Holophaga sp.]|nr:beta-propeller fold lactonase family protein [Holophaga sp.]